MLLWGNFIYRLHLQACITFHKINLSINFQSLSAHIYTNIQMHVTSWCMSFLFIGDTHTNTCFKNLQYNISYTSFLSQTDCCARYLLLAVVRSQIFSIAQNVTTSLHSLNRNSSITACLVLVVLLGSELLSVLISWLWLNLKGFCVSYWQWGCFLMFIHF